MNHICLLYPYEETEFKILDPSQGLFKVETPWMTSSFQIEVGSKNFNLLLNFISTAPENKNIFFQHPFSLNTVFKELDHFPLFYFLPRHDLPFGEDNPSSNNIPRHHLESPQSLAHFLKIPFAEHYPLFWSWDFETLLEFSKCSQVGLDLYDPLSLLSCMRRFHYLDRVENKIQAVYDSIQNIPNHDERKKAQAIVLRQNHFVTEKCHESLLPALANAKSAKKTLQEFIHAEKGHDLLLSRGVEALGFLPENLPLTPAVQSLMALLKTIAEHSFLGFCAAIDFFESPQFGESDHLAAMMLKNGEKEAARVLEIHKNINDQGGHEAISMELVQFLKPIDKRCSLEAASMAELVSYTIAQVPYHLEQLLENSKL